MLIIKNPAWANQFLFNRVCYKMYLCHHCISYFWTNTKESSNEVHVFYTKILSIVLTFKLTTPFIISIKFFRVKLGLIIENNCGKFFIESLPS